MQTRIYPASSGILAATVDRKALADALALFRASGAPIIEKSNTIPILSCVLISAGVDKLTLLGTDLDMTLTVELPAASEGTGAIAIGIEALRAALKAAKGESVRLATVDRGATLASDSGIARLPALPAADFPTMVEGDPASFVRFPIDPETFAHDLSRVAVAVSTEETRFYLNGIFFHAMRVAAPAERTADHEAACDELADLRAEQARHERATAPMDSRVDSDVGEPDEPETVDARAARMAELRDICDAAEAVRCAPDSLRMAATDGHRLHYITRPLPEGAAVLPDSILPRKAVTWIRKHGLKGASSCSLAFSRTKCVLQVGRMRLVTKLIDGTFPDYQRVIPSRSVPWAADVHKLTVGAGTMKTAALASVAHCNEKTRATTISVGDGWANAVGTSPDHGTNAALIDGLEYEPKAADGDAYVCGFNAKYLAATMECFGDARVLITMQDASAPCRMDPVDEGEFGAVLMPMSVSGTPWTPERLRRLNRDAVEAFNEEAADAWRHVAQCEEAQDRKSPIIKRARMALGDILTAAIDLTASRIGDRQAARLEILSSLATMVGQPHPYAVRAGAALATAGAELETIPPTVEAVELETIEPPTPEPMPAQPDEPMPGPQPDETAPVEPEPVDAAPMFRTLQDFKAAAGVGSRWVKALWQDGAWNYGASPQTRTVARSQARDLAFAWGDMTPDEAARRGREDRNNLAWLGFPKQGTWRSDAGGLIILYGDGSPNCRFDPLPPLDVPQAPAAPVAAPAADGEVAALREMVEALTRRLEAIEGIARGDAPAVGRQPRTAAHVAAVRRAWKERGEARAARKRVSFWQDQCEAILAEKAALGRRIARLGAVLQGRKAQIVQLGRELLISRNRAADMRAAGETPVIASVPVDSSPAPIAEPAPQPLPSHLRGRIAPTAPRMVRMGGRMVRVAG